MQVATCSEASHPLIGDMVDIDVVLSDIGVSDTEDLKKAIVNLCDELKKRSGGACFIEFTEPHGSVKIKVQVSLLSSSSHSTIASIAHGTFSAMCMTVVVVDAFVYTWDMLHTVVARLEVTTKFVNMFS